MSKVKAILIDPFACEVSHVEIEGGNLKSYYDQLSHATMPVDCFTAAPVDIFKGRDALFVDDEGLFKDAQRWFIIASGHQGFAGKGLIIGADADGDAADAETSIGIVRMTVMFAEMVEGPGIMKQLAVTRTPWEPDNKSEDAINHALERGEFVHLSCVASGSKFRATFASASSAGGYSTAEAADPIGAMVRAITSAPMGRKPKAVEIDDEALL